MNRLSSGIFYVGISLAMLLTASCKNNDDGAVVTPKGVPPVWGPDMHKEMITIIEQLDSFHVPPLQTLTAPTARAQLTIFDAEKEVARLNGISGPVATADTFSREIPVAGGSIHARIYKPHSGNGPFPTIIYYHGGGWTIGSVKTYDATARSLVEQTAAMVVSVDYRTGPENKFPTAHNDAYTAYKWVIENAGTLPFDANKLAVCGEGAGANLACNVCIAARNDVIRTPIYQLLICPIAEGGMNTPSYGQYAGAEPLSKTLASWMQTNYLTQKSDTSDTRISLLNADLHGLPPTTIINADIDPLRDDGLYLETMLKNAGVSVTRTLFNGVTHDFYGLSIILPEARQAQGIGAAALRTAFQ